MMASFYLFASCCLLRWSRRPADARAAQAKRRGRWSGRTRAEPLRGETRGRGLGNYRVLAAAVCR